MTSEGPQSGSPAPWRCIRKVECLILFWVKVKCFLFPHMQEGSSPTLAAWTLEGLLQDGVTGLSCQHRAVVSNSSACRLASTGLVWPLFAFSGFPSRQAHALFAQAPGLTRRWERNESCMLVRICSSQHLNLTSNVLSWSLYTGKMGNNALYASSAS